MSNQETATSATESLDYARMKHENYARAVGAMTGLTAGLSNADARATLEHLARLVREAQGRRR